MKRRGRKSRWVREGGNRGLRRSNEITGVVKIDGATGFDVSKVES